MTHALDRYLQYVTPFIALRSVSTDAQFRDEVGACAAWLARLFGEHGFNAQTIDGYGNPIVVARYAVDESLPTCLIYGHYDVQPAKKEDGWLSDPFTLTERDGRFYARGAVDNKGQVMIHIATVLKLIEEKRLGCNIVFMIEGDEETGSAQTDRFLQEHRELVACDYVLISDGEGVGTEPAFEASFRGGGNVEVTFETARLDMHSGLFGGIVHNAAQCAAAFVSNLGQALPETVLQNQKPLGAGLQPPPEEVVMLMPRYDAAALSANTGGTLTIAEQHAMFSLGFMPSIEVTGFESGYNDDGFRNAIPHKATLKLNVRLAPTQPAEECQRRFIEYVEKQPFVSKVTSTNWNDGLLLKDSPYLDRAKRVVKEVCGVVHMRPCGASIPITTEFDRILGVPQVMLSLGNEDCAMHAPNENIVRACVEQGLRISEKLFSA